MEFLKVSHGWKKKLEVINYANGGHFYFITAYEVVHNTVGKVFMLSKLED